MATGAWFFLCAYCRCVRNGRRTKKPTFSTPPRPAKVARAGAYHRGDSAAATGVAWAKRSSARVTGERGKVVYRRGENEVARFYRTRPFPLSFHCDFPFSCTAAGTYIHVTPVASWALDAFLFLVRSKRRRPKRRWTTVSGVLVGGGVEGALPPPPRNSISALIALFSFRRFV